MAAGGGTTGRTTASHERALKIDPELSRGEPVKVARAANQTEAEFLQGLLLEAGMPSLVRRSPGFDVPDFMAAGPRDVLVPGAGADAARQVLLEADAAPAQEDAVAPVAPRRLLAGLLIALAVGVLVIWLISLAVR